MQKPRKSLRFIQNQRKSTASFSSVCVCCISAMANTHHNRHTIAYRMEQKIVATICFCVVACQRKSNQFFITLKFRKQLDDATAVRNHACSLALAILSFVYPHIRRSSFQCSICFFVKLLIPMSPFHLAFCSSFECTGTMHQYNSIYQLTIVTDREWSRLLNS